MPTIRNSESDRAAKADKLTFRCAPWFRKRVQVLAIERGQTIEEMLVEVIGKGLKIAAPKSEAA